MVELKRKKGETFEAFFRRFTRTLQGSGRLRQARKIQYHEKEKSRPERRKAAQVRNSMREKRAYLEKVGRLPEEDMRKKRSGRN